MKRLFAELSKVEEQDDGTLKVWGYASSGAVDSDGETITPSAMKAALPDYMKWANVREMHQAKAAGTAIEAEVQDDGRTWFGAHVIDSEAVKKVRAGVYKGFSIGGKITSRDKVNKTIIDGVTLSEVSLVDRPANPEAVFTMMKMDAEKVGDEVAPVLVVADPIEKAGSRFSSTTKVALKAAHDALKAADKALVDLGYESDSEPDGDEAGKAAIADDLKKVADSAATAAKDSLEKLSAVTAERDALAKRAAEFDAMPAPAVGILKVVGKSDDGSGVSGKAAAPADVLKFDGSIDREATALQLIKFAHKNPVRMQ